MNLLPLAQSQKKSGGSVYPCKVLKTDQVTQFSGELDDGYYQSGEAKSYQTNTTGAQSGTTNVALAHYAGTAGAMTFNNTTKKITDTGSGLAIFKTGDVILTDSPNNPGPFTITTGNVAGEIVCSGATFSNETPAGVITIFKRESISNNTVLDLKTGLTWLRYASVKMGAYSNGRMPWTGQLFDIFAWCAACNAANVGGFSDWKIPNVNQLLSLQNWTSNVFNASAFPSTPGYMWTSTTRYAVTTSALYRDNSISGAIAAYSKAGDGTLGQVMLVRGG